MKNYYIYIEKITAKLNGYELNIYLRQELHVFHVFEHLNLLLKNPIFCRVIAFCRKHLHLCLTQQLQTMDLEGSAALNLFLPVEKHKIKI